ncbi:MAG TPA: hypothetical protein VGN55_10675 [Xanthobacteraceae bacterium]|jgi:hypothetical protein
MSYPRIISLAVIAALGVALVSTDASARRGVYRGPNGAVAWRTGGYRGGAVAWRGGAYRGGYWRPGVGAAAVGVAAVGAAAASSYYAPRCGYYPYPPCY